MAKLTTSLHRGAHYAADWIAGPHGGLCVTRRRGKGGALIATTSPDATTWREAIATAVDAQEAEALCRAVLQSTGA